MTPEVLVETSLLEDKSEQKEVRGGEALHVGPGGGRGTSKDAGGRGTSKDGGVRGWPSLQ